MDPKRFLNSNNDLIAKRCRDNWIDSPEKTKMSLLEVITRLDNLRLDDSGTNDYLEEWLANNDQTAMRVHIDLLFRAIECNLSFVYATNYLIRRMNRLDNTSIKLRDDRYLKKMREILMIQDMSIFDSVVVSSFPDPEERHHFLVLIHHELSNHKTLPLGVMVDVSNDLLKKRIKSLLLLTSKKVDQYCNQSNTTSNEPTAGQKALIIFYRYRIPLDGKPMKEIINYAFSKEGWVNGSHTNIRNLYYSIGKRNDKDPLNKNNIHEILLLLNEDERETALIDLK